MNRKNHLHKSSFKNCFTGFYYYHYYPHFLSLLLVQLSLVIIIFFKYAILQFYQR